MQDQTSKEQDSGQTSMFGPPPIINGENASDYNELLLRASSALTPKDGYVIYSPTLTEGVEYE